jgi:hypothetical protein
MSSRSLWIVAVLAIAVRVVPAYLVPGTEDVGAWRFVLDVEQRGGDPYLQPYPFNWPPFWVAAVMPLVRGALALGIPYYGPVKTYPILADALIAVLIVRAIERTTGDSRKALLSGLFYALNPISIVLTSVHGNFVSVSTAFLLLAAFLLWFGRAKWSSAASALVMGFAIMSKLWPAIFLPLLLARVRTWIGRALYLSLSAIFPAWLVASLYFRPNGDAILEKFFGYQSIAGMWGFTGLWHLSASSASRELSQVYARHGSKVLGLALVALYLTRTRRAGRFEAFVLIGSATLFFAQGFGLQYLLWVLPFAILARDSWAIAYTILVSAEFAVEYGFRPFRGEFGALVATASPLDLTEAERWNDVHVTNLIRLPVWLFLGAWMIRSARTREPGPIEGSGEQAGRPLELEESH